MKRTSDRSGRRFVNGAAANSIHECAVSYAAVPSPGNSEPAHLGCGPQPRRAPAAVWTQCLRLQHASRSRLRPGTGRRRPSPGPELKPLRPPRGWARPGSVNTGRFGASHCLTPAETDVRALRRFQVELENRVGRFNGAARGPFLMSAAITWFSFTSDSEL